MTTKSGRVAKATSVRVSPLAKQLWDKLAEHTGLTNTGVLETAIRRMAKEEGITAELTDSGKPQ